ncbi:MAG TPA: aldolase/citrate lyase family protein [Stellaceae bacterium]|jgi:2-keto-3-deoxy-L-rhamnonate aldolase RhmA|nr:aldolase/citrate lyase family protein [Stellaceae bacterium]
MEMPARDGATLTNPVKERMTAGEVALGLNVRIARSGDIARIAKTTGHDFIFIDVQHSLFSLETIGHIAQAALGCGIAPLARVRSCGDPDTSLLLDNGVTGVVFPDVNNAADARRGVDAAKFAPIGKRSVSGGYPVFDYRAVPVGDSMRMLNDATLVVCMIETREGLANIEEIAAVDGVDVIHVGSNDLLTALGKPGRFDDPEIFSAIDRAIAAARSHGKFAGLGGMRNVERQVELIRKGVRFVTTQTDIGFLLAAAGRWTGDLRAALAQPAR